jgi:hypothetical protein
LDDFTSPTSQIVPGYVKNIPSTTRQQVTAPKISFPGGLAGVVAVTVCLDGDLLLGVGKIEPG